MTTKTTVILIYSFNSILLVGSVLVSSLIFKTLGKIADMEQKNDMVIQQPYLSEHIRAEQNALLERSQRLSKIFIQDPNQSIGLIQEIEALAVDSNINLEVHLDEKNQQPFGSVSLVPIEFDGTGSWDGFITFQRALRDTKPGFFLDEVALSNQSGNTIQFSLNYTLLWLGNL